MLYRILEINMRKQVLENKIIIFGDNAGTSFDNGYISKHIITIGWRNEFIVINNQCFSRISKRI